MPDDEDRPKTGWPAMIARAFGESRAFAVAAALSAIWLLGVLAYAAGFFGLFDDAGRPASALEIAFFFLAALAPLALIAFGAFLWNEAEAMRREARAISAALGAHPAAPRPAAPEGAGTLSAIHAAQAETRAALQATQQRLEALEATLAALKGALQRAEPRAESPARREAKTTAPAPAPAPDRAQPPLPMMPAPEPQQGVRWASVARALDFPHDKNDRAGFAALRETLKEREFAELLQAAEDVLTLFAGDGLYMEDLTPASATLEQWVAYIGGARGADVGAVGGIADEDVLAKVRTRMRGDVIFRDSALHFLRRFDRLLGRMARELGPDPLIMEAANSRTGRAFMIVARVTGAFD